MVALRKDVLSISGQNWLVGLAQVVETYGGDTVTEVDSLLVKVMEDFTGGIVLKKILAWLATVDRDYIWKSDREWDAELGLSYSQVKRLREKVLAPIVTCYQKSARNRSMHYRLNALELMKKIAHVLKVGFMQVASILMNPESACSGKSRMHSKVSRETLTKKQTNSSSSKHKDVVVNDFIPSFEKSTKQLLMDAGLKKSTVLKYMGLKREIVLACVEDADKMRASNKIKKSYQAYLTGALNIQLNQQEEQAKVSEMLKQSTQETDDVPVETPPAEDRADAISVPTADVPTWWKAFLVQMETQLPLHIWTYFQNLVFASDDAEVVTFHVPPVVPMNLVERYNRNLQRWVRECLGERELRFEGVQL